MKLDTDTIIHYIAMAREILDDIIGLTMILATLGAIWFFA